MSLAHILSAWELSKDAKLSEFSQKPLRADAAYIVESDSAQYLLFAFPSQRQDSVIKAMSRSVRAMKQSIPSVVPVVTKSKQQGHTDGDAFWVLYPHHGEPLSGQALVHNLTLATQLGEQFAALPNQFPVVDVDYPPSNVFSPVFQQDLLGLVTDDHDLDTILEANLYLQRHFEAVLPWLDQEFVHGDLHPGNMYLNNGTILFHDWEYARQELCLYDVMFFLGCLGFESLDNLTSDWALEFLRSNTEVRPVSWLTAETAFPLLICSRMHWLHLWLSLGEQDLIVQEQAYLKALLAKRDDVYVAWGEAWTIKKPSQKWVVTDAGVPPLIKAFLAKHTLEEVSALPFEEWPLVMIALGKEKRLADMIRWIDQLVDDWFQGELKAPLFVLTQMMVNLSLDLARNLQQAGLYRLKAMLSWMQEEAPQDESILIAQGYVLRNLSMMLGDTGRIEASFEAIETLEGMWLDHEDNVSLAEELARACAGGLVTALSVEDKDKGPQYFARLDELLFKFPESEKIKTAFLISQKQNEQ